MSTYNIRNLFPFKRVKIKKIETGSSGAITLVKLVPDERFSPICSNCKKPFISIHSKHIRAVRDMPMSGSLVIIYLSFRKGFCDSCNGIKVEYHDFVEPYQRFTNRFAQYVYELCKHLTVKDVADFTKLSWDQVKQIDKKSLKRDHSKNLTKHLSILCVDEISLKKHHHYLTIVANYLTGQVIAVVKNRDYESVAKFLKKLKSNIVN